MLSENWKNCHPKVWEFQPDHRYRFSVDDFRCMEGEDIVTDKEIQAFYEVYDLTGKKLKAANLLRISYALAEWFLKQRERTAREHDEYEKGWSRNSESDITWANWKMT